MVLGFRALGLQVWGFDGGYLKPTQTWFFDRGAAIEEVFLTHVTLFLMVSSRDGQLDVGECPER